MTQTQEWLYNLNKKKNVNKVKKSWATAVQYTDQLKEGPQCQTCFFFHIHTVEKTSKVYYIQVTFDFCVYFVLLRFQRILYFVLHPLLDVAFFIRLPWKIKKS